jgi:predicted ester cyclase
MSEASSLKQRREATVRQHMDSENRLDFEATMRTFEHPRYELFGGGEVFDGPDEVREYFKNSRAVFPDQRNRLIAMHETDDAMIVEFDLMGTHKGAMRGVAPTRKTFTQRMIAMFVFPPGGDHIICERVYFDSLNIQRQLGVLAA